MSRLAGTPGIALTFFVLSLVKIAHHEMWRDELEYWDAARQSHSLPELRENTRYMGQPPLGHLALYSLSRVTRDPRALQVLNVVIVTAAVVIVSAFAPWPTRIKWLFAFGYFPFFEYGTISRHYGLSLLLLVASCAAWRARPRAVLGSAALLGLLALSHFHATLVAIAALAAATGESCLSRRRPIQRELAGAGFVAAAIAVAVVLSIPPPDSYFLQPFRFDLSAERFVEVTGHLWRGYAPWPPWIDSFWNHNVLDAFPATEAALGLCLVGAFGWALRRERAALLFFLAATGGLLLFYYAQRVGKTRHDGLFFLVLVAALWLGSARTPSLPPLAARLFTAILAFQVGAGLIASVKDLTLPFSQSGAVADALQAAELSGLPIVGDADFAAAAVAARLQRPVYFVSVGRFASRVVWANERRTVHREDLDAAVRRVQRNSGQDVILLLNYELDPIGRLEKLRCFEGAIIANETYCLYRAHIGAAGFASSP